MAGTFEGGFYLASRRASHRWNDAGMSELDNLLSSSTFHPQAGNPLQLLAVGSALRFEVSRTEKRPTRRNLVGKWWNDNFEVVKLMLSIAEDGSRKAGVASLLRKPTSSFGINVALRADHSVVPGVPFPTPPGGAPPVIIAAHPGRGQDCCSASSGRAFV